MTWQILMGSKDGNLELVVQGLNSVLGIPFVVRESSYRGGVYFLGEDENRDLRVLVRRNWDVMDDCPEDPEFPDHLTFLEVIGPSAPDVASAVIAGLPSIVELRRKQYRSARESNQS